MYESDMEARKAAVKKRRDEREEADRKYEQHEVAQRVGLVDEPV
jgi:hypothetical protein